MGIKTHNPRLQSGFVVEDKAERVYHYANNVGHEIEIICHSCGVEEPRQLKRSHVRIVRENGFSISLAKLFTDKQPLPEYSSKAAQ